MNARQHKRSQSNGLKPPTAHARSSRPSLSAKRNAGYNHAAVTHPSANLRRQKSSTEVVKQSDTDSTEDIMAASFLQFWYVPVDPPSCNTLDPVADLLLSATCERQIVTPNFSLLYCSES